MEGWRPILVRFQLYVWINFAECLRIINRLLSVNIDSPWKLAHHSYKDINRISLELADSVNILSLWQASCIANTHGTSAGSLIPFRRSAALVAQYFRVGDIDDSAPAKKRRSIIGEFPLGNDFDLLGPVSKMGKKWRSLMRRPWILSISQKLV